MRRPGSLSQSGEEAARPIPGGCTLGPKERGPAQRLLVLKASLDHILPHSRGGDNDPSNLVTACYPCQFGRSSWTLEEVGLTDPRLRPPVVDNWDGLMRLARI